MLTKQQRAAVRAELASLWLDSLARDCDRFPCVEAMPQHAAFSAGAWCAAAEIARLVGIDPYEVTQPKEA